MDRTLAALTDYKAIIDTFPVTRIRLIGTQALREAANAAEFAAEVKTRVGLNLEIISGAEEAYLSYSGAARGLVKPEFAFPLVLDIGAGSTEIMWETALGANATNDAQVVGASAPIGSLRLLEKPLNEQGILQALATGWGNMRIPTARNQADSWSAPEAFASIPPSAASASSASSASLTASASPAPSAPSSAAASLPPEAHLPDAGGSGPLVGVGGTATIMGAIHLAMREYNPERLLGLRLNRRQVQSVLDQMESLTPAQRLTLPGMVAGREDVMPWGLKILLAAMTYCRRDSVVICDRDLLYGAIHN
jgi:exopolyphosphatase/guanosine-5'-triphosphate,3'-diphosphate pyrophosphatase